MKRIALYAALAAAILVCLAWAATAQARPDGGSTAWRPAWRPYAANAAVAANQQFESSKGWYFTNLVLCAGQEAAIADQPLQVYASSYTLFPVNGDCGGLPAPISKDIGVKWVLQVSNDLGIHWSNCRAGDWAYAHTSFMDRSHSWSGTPPCGNSKFYRAKGFAKVKYNGSWHQGSRHTKSIFVLVIG